MENFFEVFFSNSACIAALQNSESIDALVLNLNPHFPEISSEKIRELFSIPSSIHDEFCLDYIFTLLEKMESMIKEDDSFLASVAGGINSGELVSGMTPGSAMMGAGGAALGSYMTTAAYIGLGTQVLGGGLSLTNTMLGGREQRKTQSEGFAQQKELISLQVDEQIRLLKFERGF